MQQAKSNISHFPSRIELLWKRHEAATNEKARIYALAEVAVAATDAAFDMAEAAADAAYSALEDIVDEILAAEATSVTDLAIEARVLAARGVEDVGFSALKVSSVFSPTCRHSPHDSFLHAKKILALDTHAKPCVALR
ncbi:MAG: hypothetical protein ACXWBM_11740 [Chthoniobacterales bacterium]